MSPALTTRLVPPRPVSGSSQGMRASTRPPSSPRAYFPQLDGDGVEQPTSCIKLSEDSQHSADVLIIDRGHHANGNGHAAVEVNGNGHSDEVPEPQQSLFSWAEFMAEEPVKPKGRGRKPQPAAASLFEWALTVEQEREEEPVGAGR